MSSFYKNFDKIQNRYRAYIKNFVFISQTLILENS